MPRFAWLILTLVLLALVACGPFRGVYHTVQKGQTLYQIARSYDVDPDELARLNGVRDPRLLAVGDRLFIPGAGRVLRVPATVPTVSPAPPEAPKAIRHDPPPVKPSGAASVPKSSMTRSLLPKAVQQPASPSGTKRPAPGKGALGWPVRGSIVKKFGSKLNSPGRYGIEIAIREQTPVLSSAAGKVIYSGNGISGYGNLIIIQHAGSLYTIYGYNRKNLVAAGSFVGKGDKIALSGVPPSGGVPRLYFEVRHGKKPVDPIFYLP